MIEASEAWKDIQQRFLLPESHIEIDCTIAEVGAQESATASGTVEAVFSDAGSVLGVDAVSARYATNELNLWSLDGSREIVPDLAPYETAGYVSDIESTGSVTLSFPEVRTTASAGITITWGSRYGEYPSVFTVTAKNGEMVVNELTITDNTQQVSAVYMPLSNYDSITITVQNWYLPHRRARIEKVVLGHVLLLTKKDILSYTHEQHGDLLSGAIPKSSIEFTLDNTDGRWNPNNPSGMEQYLSERQKLTVRYGLDVNGVIEWIKAGTFYLSEWHTPSNGLEARFVARDVFEFMIDEEMWSALKDSLSNWIETATSNLPDGSLVVIDPSLENILAEYTPSYTTGVVSTNAEIVQKCANAGCCILRYDRDGILHVEPLNMTDTGYRITQALSFTHPEVELSKPLKEISVDYGDGTPYVHAVAASGTQQTVSNDFIGDATNAEKVATWIGNVLKSRRTVSGEFRADPRVDLFDIVTVESKYGALTPVVITNIAYSFNGSFRGSYTGRVLEEVSS